MHDARSASPAAMPSRSASETPTTVSNPARGRCGRCARRSRRGWRSGRARSSCSPGATRNSGCPNSTSSPLLRQTSTIVPATPTGPWFISFITSIRQTDRVGRHAVADHDERRVRRRLRAVEGPEHRRLDLDRVGVRGGRGRGRWRRGRGRGGGGAVGGGGGGGGVGGGGSGAGPAPRCGDPPPRVTCSENARGLDRQLVELRFVDDSQDLADVVVAERQAHCPRCLTPKVPSTSDIAPGRRGGHGRSPPAPCAVTGRDCRTKRFSGNSPVARSPTRCPGGCRSGARPREPFPRRARRRVSSRQASVRRSGATASPGASRDHPGPARTRSACRRSSRAGPRG